MAEVTMEEMDEQFSAEEVKAAPKAADIKLDASDLPDFAQGKTAADLAGEVARTREALRISEDARLAMRAAVEAGGERREVRTPAPTGPQALTRDQLKELMQEDPMAVVDYMATHLTHNLDRHVSSRFAPMVANNVSAAEAAAQARYKDEFELFGDQIEAAKKVVDASILANSRGWDDVISYIRGQPQNFDKLIERRSTTKTKASAREEQISDTGFTPRATAKAPVVVDTQGLDATELEICRVMDINPKDYKKYK